MAVIVNSIGTNGRDFATISAWWSSIPTDVVASGNSYVGQMYNDSEFLVTTSISLNGKTTGGSNTIRLECAPGHSFTDNPNRFSNALDYNISNGVGVRTTNSVGSFFNIQQRNLTITGLQVWNAGSGSNGNCFNFQSGSDASWAENCLIKLNYSGSGSNALACSGGNARNILAILNSPFSSGLDYNLNSGGIFENLTIVRPSNIVATGGSAVKGASGSKRFVNVAAFNVPQFGSRTDHVGSNNAFDKDITFGTNNQPNLVYENQFVSTINDFRTKAGSSLIDNGIQSSSTSSVSGVTRPSGAAYDIGAYEYQQVATTITATAEAAYIGAACRISVSVNGLLTQTTTISFYGTGGTFSATSVVLEPGTSTGFVNFTPSSAGEKTITITNNRSLTNPTPLTISVGSVGLVMGIVTNYLGTPSKVNISVSGTLNQTVTVTPSVTGGGTFSPTTRQVSPSTLNVSFDYTPASVGIKTISISNNGNLDNPEPQNINIVAEPKIRTPNPTPSTSSQLVVSVGAGKDYANLQDFSNFLGSQNLITNGYSILAEVYDDLTLSGGLQTGPSTQGQDADHFCVIRPVRGCSEAEMNPTGMYNYGVDGIQLTVPGSWKLLHGVVIEGFRINMINTGVMYISGRQQSAPVGRNEIIRNRIRSRSTATDFIGTGEFNVPGVITDNLIIRDTGTSAIGVGNNATVSRNTLVATTSSSNILLRSTSGNIKVENNVFVNVGDNPVSLTSTSATVNNNYTDVVMTVPRTGITVDSVNPLIQSFSDFRPTVGSLLVGNANDNAISINDQRGANRGLNPDVGSYQLVPATPLPLGTINGDLVVDGQQLNLTFATSNSPNSGTASLSPAATNPGEATFSMGTVTFAGNTGIVSFSNIVSGNYALSITIGNDGGFTKVAGPSSVSVLGISGNPQAVSSGIAPELTVPSKPINVVATGQVNGVSVNGSILSNGGSDVLSYTVVASTGQTETSASLPVFVAMPQGVLATFTLVASNSVGDSPVSDASNAAQPTEEVVVTVPSAPSMVATADNNAIIVNVTEPDSDGNSTILSYTVTLSSGETQTRLGSTFVFQNLDATPRYAFAFATNSEGNSPVSQNSNTVTPIVPYIPTIKVNLKFPEQDDVPEGTRLIGAWFDASTPANFTNVAWTGEVFVGPLGEINLQIPDSNLLLGEIGWLILTDSDGTVEKLHRSFSGPVDVI